METNSWIPFHIVACSSEEKGTQIELLATNQYSPHKSWESSRVSDYPVEIVLRFHYRSELDYCVLASKQDKNIPEIEFHIGDGLAGSFLDVEYRLAGKVENIINKATQIKLLGIGSYLKVLIPKPPKKSQMNPFGQVSIATLKLWGRKTAYFTRIKNEELPLTNNKSAIDKILIGLGVPVDLIAWFDEDDRNYQYAPIDEDSRQTLRDMEKLKTDCLKSGDFSGLKTLIVDMKKVFDIGLEIWKWRKELEFCIAKEDFSRAIDLKHKIKRLEAQRDAFDALYETSRYEAMIVIKRPVTAEIAFAQQLWDEEQRAKADELRRQRELEEKERQRILEEERERMRLNQKQPYQDTAPGYSAPVVIKKRKIKKEKEEEDLKARFINPFNYNEGDVDLELYLKPLLAGIGEKLGECNVEILRRLYHKGYLTVFGARIWNAINSENWRHREAAAQAVLNFIEMPLPEKYLEGRSKKLFLACMEMARIACEDKILQIYYIGLKILSTALAPPVCGKDVSPKLINKVLKEFTPLLIEKISELNYRARDISLHTLLSVFKHPAAKLNILMNCCLELCRMDPNFPSLFVPVDKQQWRFILSRLEIILQIIEEFGYNEREWNWKEVFDLILSPSLFHSNNDIRVLAIEIIVALYEMIGEEVRVEVNNLENLKPNLLQQINERLESVKDLAEKNQLINQERKKIEGAQALDLVEEVKEEHFDSPKSTANQSRLLQKGNREANENLSSLSNNTKDQGKKKELGSGTQKKERSVSPKDKKGVSERENKEVESQAISPKKIDVKDLKKSELKDKKDDNIPQKNDSKVREPSEEKKKPESPNKNENKSNNNSQVLQGNKPETKEEPKKKKKFLGLF